ncbi:TetR/AcrR family transcriptional regulator [Ornithinimicrobium panacihumi]|uniref:TetR/AcrR family transcriptional regulator n=1 Tax=Ornithinimicrobium panacihumi TaxID=2008449 RepID=UPI003F8CD208
MGVREQQREHNVARILAAAREQIAQVGGVGLSMRAVAREVGMVSSAVYRYFPTREALITALVLESYEALGAALTDVPAGEGAERWTALAHALRQWAVAHPHDFQLIYGTPVPGHAAPPETIPAAERVARPFLEAGAPGEIKGFDDPALLGQVGPLASAVGVDRSGSAAVLAELAQLVGLLSLELGGHLVGTADPADHLFAAAVDRQTRTLGLT